VGSSPSAGTSSNCFTPRVISPLPVTTTAGRLMLDQVVGTLSIYFFCDIPPQRGHPCGHFTPTPARHSMPDAIAVDGCGCAHSGREGWQRSRCRADDGLDRPSEKHERGQWLVRPRIGCLAFCRHASLDFRAGGQASRKAHELISGAVGLDQRRFLEIPPRAPHSVLFWRREKLSGDVRGWGGLRRCSCRRA
jgi:hypothetical protein